MCRWYPASCPPFSHLLWKEPPLTLRPRFTGDALGDWVVEPLNVSSKCAPMNRAVRVAPTSHCANCLGICRSARTKGGQRICQLAARNRQIA